jgi:hypothetical protein
MLLRITDRCHGHCSHCMIQGSSPKGEHMSMDTFNRALGFVRRTQTKVLLVSGGEPFEHPRVFDMAERLKQVALEDILFVSFASNGHFCFDDDKMRKVEAMGIGVQVTCDHRYYSKLVPRERFTSEQFFFEDTLRTIFPCERSQASGIATNRQSPTCFNLRSATRSLGYIVGTSMLALKGRVCTPAINIDGSVVAGEADTCHKLGTVDMSLEELHDSICNMRCNRCGLGDNLSQMHLDAIGGAA